MASNGFIPMSVKKKSDIMYHETYHPLKDEDFDQIMFGSSEQDKKVAREQVDAAIKGKIRNYTVTIIPESKSYDGRWFKVENGIVIGSQDLGGK